MKIRAKAGSIYFMAISQLEANQIWKFVPEY